MPANAPGRSSGTVPVTIGLVTLQLSLYSATEDSAVKRSQYVKALDDQGNEVLHPVGMHQYDKVTGATVEKSDIIKCVESSDGTLVPVTDEELQAFLSDNGTSEFIGFLDRSKFEETYVPEKKYQVRPAKLKVGGKSQKGESPFAKPFMLILDGMRSAGVVALVKFVSRGTARHYALLPDGSFYSLLFDEEVREDLPLPVVQFTPAEKKVAEQLVKKFAVKEAPVLTDESATKIMEFVETKAAAMADGTEVVLPTINDTEVDTSSDLMAMFEASVQ